MPWSTVDDIHGATTPVEYDPSVWPADTRWYWLVLSVSLLVLLAGAVFFSPG